MIGQENGENTRRETRSSTQLLLKDLLTPAEIGSLSNDSKLLYKALEKSISSHISKITEHYDTQLALKDSQIQTLSEKVSNLESNHTTLLDKIKILQNELDDAAQYQRRDTLIFSGNIIPSETTDENSTEIVVETIKSHLKVPISINDISIAHRLGKNRNGFSRPIIVKLISRTKKSQIVQARISQPKPNNNGPTLYVNESLTPIRRTLLYKLRQLRKSHSGLFKALHTHDGKIIVKLSATNDRKYVITTEQHLLDFLKISPVLQDAYQQL